MLKILSWNVNGIRAVYSKGMFESVLKLKPDILCLQETKASEEQIPKDIQINGGFQEAYFSSAERKGYSGVAIYTRIIPMDISRGFNIEEFDREGRIIQADFGDFVLMNIYFPNGKASEERLRYKMSFYDAFLDYAESIKAHGKNIIVCGDVNTAHKEIDLARPKENEEVSGFLPEERAWMDKFFSYGYVDTFRTFNQSPDQYTWWTYRAGARARNVGWRIDYFFVNQEFLPKVKNAYILPEIMGSDHCPVAIEVEVD